MNDEMFTGLVRYHLDKNEILYQSDGVASTIYLYLPDNKTISAVSTSYKYKIIYDEECMIVEFPDKVPSCDQLIKIILDDKTQADE